MHLLVESGSTKSSWRVCDSKDIIASFEAPGLNPSTQDEAELTTGLAHIATLLDPYKSGIDTLYFYGAGLSKAPKKAYFKNLLSTFIPMPSIFVFDDLQAAARATLREKGIVCILGTGSNACKHQNGEIIERKGGLGYLLGDEGSGFDLGKHFLKGLLSNDFPQQAEEHLILRTGKNAIEIQLEVYQATRPNVEIAKLSSILQELIILQPLYDMVRLRFRDFLQSSVAKFRVQPLQEIDFVGSIAWYFQAPLQDALQEEGLSMGQIIAHPIDRLYLFHSDLQTR